MRIKAAFNERLEQELQALQIEIALDHDSGDKTQQQMRTEFEIERQKQETRKEDLQK